MVVEKLLELLKAGALAYCGICSMTGNLFLMTMDEWALCSHLEQLSGSDVIPGVTYDEVNDRVVFYNRSQIWV